MSLSQAHIAPWTLLLTLTACTPAPVHAQVTSLAETPMRFERLDGLTHNTVTALLQDREGFLWIGTSDGLNRYDGYDFVVYRHDRFDSTSLSNNVVKALLEDQAGTLWVGTDGGLDRFDRRTGRFIRYSLRPAPLASQAQAIFALLEDHAGRLWVGTDDGLYRYEGKRDRFAAYRHEPDNPNSLANDDIWSLYEGRDRTLWVGTVGGVLHRYDPEAEHFVRFAVSEAWHYVTVLYEDEAGRLWLSDLLDHTSAFTPSNGDLSALPGVPAGQVLRAFLEGRRGIRWMGTFDGLYRYDPAQGTHRHVRTDLSPGAFLQNNVRSLYEDRTGTLWAGTLSGLYRLDPHAKPFHHLGHDPTDPNSLTSNTVMAVWEDTDGLLWVGTLGGGLNQIDRTTGIVTRFRHRPDRPNGLCNDLIWSLYQDRRGTLWIGTDEGLCTLDRQTGRFTHYTLPLKATETKQPPINALREDQAGRLWIASTIGLYRLDPQTRETKWYAQSGDSSGDAMSGFFIQSLYVDQAGLLWLGAFGGVLYRLDPDADTFTRYPLRFSEERELVSEGIWAIHEDEEGILWLGSDQGLTRFDPQSGAARHFTQREGLPGSIVYGILQDDLLGRLWLSTNHGLARFDERLPEDRRVRVYDAGDGLENTEFNRRAAFKGQNGHFYFGGLGGLTWFAPTAIQDNLVVPPVVLTRIETSNRDTTVSVNPSGLEALVLSYRDYTISFSFTALNFTNPSKNQYRYQLQGFDKGWIEAGMSRQARYTSIPPGSYVFRVMGSNNDGRWNEEGVALPVTITPPFWQTWWFLLLVLAAVVGLLTATYRYRVSRLLEVERMRLRIASDLHDDIGSNLSSIALLSDIVRGRERLGERERRQLSKIGHSARAMVDALRDIVWSIDPDSDRPDDLVRRMKDTATVLLGETQWHFQGPANGLTGKLDMNVRRHLFLSYKEMLHNVARHAQATEVTIGLEEDNRTIRLSVSDNGIGFDEAATPPGNGLKNLQERAARIGGTLEITSTPGQGTTLQLVAPKATRRRKTT